MKLSVNIKRWISILVLSTMVLAQGAEAFHDHPITEKPLDCVVCSHAICFSLEVESDVVPEAQQDVLGKTTLEDLGHYEINNLSIVSYAPKTSPPFQLLST